METMNAVRIKLHLDSPAIEIRSPELDSFVGKNVEVIVIEEASSQPPLPRYPLRGTVYRFDRPTDPIDVVWEAA